MSYIRGEDRHQGPLFPVRPDGLIPEDGQNQITQPNTSKNSRLEALISELSFEPSTRKLQISNE
jgi:hypothetical protein